MPVCALLGPQRFHPTVAAAAAELGLEGPLALVTAGWREGELEDQELREHLGGEGINLRLHGRAEEIFLADPELSAAHRRRQGTLRQLQEVHRLRLAHTLDAARELLRRDGESGLLDPEREAAIAALRELDRHHLARIREIDAEFEERWRPWEREAVARHRADLAGALAGSGGLGIAGGHVAVLLNRLRLFGILELAGARPALPVIAWSGGTMVLAERVVVFHDSPPQGPGNAEVLEAGLGFYGGLLPLPHARRRLRLDDRQQVALFSRRFSPDVCVALDQGAWIRREEAAWAPKPGTLRLSDAGEVIEWA